MKLTIATPNMLSAIMQLIADCITHMQNKGIDQWGDFYPSEDILAEDVRQQHLYILELDHELAGIVTLNEQADPLYDTIQWPEHVVTPLMVHRLAIAPQYQGQGYGRKIMQWIEDYANRNGYPSIRLDAYQGNPSALALYERNDYIKTGEVTFPRRSQSFNVYEKILKTD